MQAIFTYGGNRKSALTPRTLLFGADPFATAKNIFTSGSASRLYSSTANYDAYATLGRLPYSPEQTMLLADLRNVISPTEMAGRIEAINVAIASLVDYATKLTSYYGTRVSRTSGGKRDRLRAERAALRNQADAQVALLKAGLASAKTIGTAMVTATQTDYNPETGRIMTPVEKEVARQNQAATQGASGMSSLILPIGAGLAALYFLKGH